MYRLYVEFVNQDPHGGWVPFGGVAVVAERLNGFRDGLGKLILRLSGDVQPGMRVGFQYAQEKMLLAAASRFWPRLMDMGTDEPTPIRSASAKLMITNGMLKFSAANAVSPRIRPTNTPSIN